MTKQVYLALYRGRADKLSHRLLDGAVRILTRGPYSHCELAVDLGNGLYDCYSSSIRDGGVRHKTMLLPGDKWHLIPVKLSRAELLAYYDQTKGADYDLLGAMGVVLHLGNHRRKYFCSEWCFNALSQTEQGYRFSPNDLAVIY